MTIKDSVVMGADYLDNADALDSGKLPLGIGSGSVISGAILDKNCRIGTGVTISNAAGVENQGEEEDLQIRDGISVVIKNGSIPNGFSC